MRHLRPHLALALGFAASMTASARAAHADVPGYAADRFEPAERGSDWFAADSLDFRGHVRGAAGAVVSWAYHAPTLRGTTVTDAVVVHVGGTVVAWDRLRAGVDVPLAPYEVRGVGDLRVSAGARLAGTYDDPVRVAADVRVFLPTGSRSALLSDGGVRVEPRLLAAATLDWFTAAASIGVMTRSGGTFAGRALGSEATATLAAGVKVRDRFVFGPELLARTALVAPGPFDVRGTPAEALLGMQVSVLADWQVGGAIGGGIGNGDGAPTMRVIVAMEWAPEVCEDLDGDRICAVDDACPREAGVRTARRSTNGCPADRDGDGIPDGDDACPDAPGGRTFDETSRGCPDRDGDGVADRVDACPDVAGRPSKDPATNGCPDAPAEPSPSSP